MKRIDLVMTVENLAIAERYLKKVKKSIDSNNKQPDEVIIETLTIQQSLENIKEYMIKLSRLKVTHD